MTLSVDIDFGTRKTYLYVMSKIKHVRDGIYTRSPLFSVRLPRMLAPGHQRDYLARLSK